MTLVHSIVCTPTDAIPHSPVKDMPILQDAHRWRFPIAYLNVLFGWRPMFRFRFQLVHYTIGVWRDIHYDHTARTTITTIIWKPLNATGSWILCMGRTQWYGNADQRENLLWEQTVISRTRTIGWDMMDQHTKHSEYIFRVQLEQWSPSPRLLLVIYSTSVWLALGTGAPFQVTITFSEIPRAKSHTQARSKFPLTLISSIWVSPCCRPSAKRRKVSISAGMAKHTSRPLPIVIEGLQLDRYNASRNTHGNDTAFPSNLGGIQIYPSQKSATGASYPDHIKTN